MHSSPIQTMIHSKSSMFTEPHFIAYPDADECDVVKAASTSPTTRSPNTVIFAVDELSSVFRVADNHDGIDHDSFIVHQTDEATIDSNNGTLRRARYLTPSSFTTDGELSTFSEDTEEASDESSGCDDVDEHPIRFYPRRRRSTAMSIFRASSGTKRRCEFEQHGDDDDITNPTKRSCSAPSLCHANPIGSDDGCDDEEEELSLSSSSYYTFASPFKRICRNGNFTVDTATAPSFTSLLSESTSTLPAATTTLKHLQHPLSLDSSVFAKLFPKSRNEYHG